MNRSRDGKKRVPEWMTSSLWSSVPSSSSVIPETRDRHSLTVPKPDDRPPPPPLHPALQSSKQTIVPEYPLPLPTRPLNASKQPITEGHTLDTPPTEITRFSPEDISRQSQLLAELSRQIIDLDELRRLASLGIPDGDAIRPIVWKLLLGYLPNDSRQWVHELQKKRARYLDFKEELLVNPSKVTHKLNEASTFKDEGHENEGSGLLSRSEIFYGEHPLSLGKTSMWNQFFQDSEIIEQIDRDVMRTHPGMHFFSGDTDLAKSNQDSLRNILIIFAKLNPGIRYVQGMNEVLAPLFYVNRNDPDSSNSAFAEPDAFFCFVQLLSGFRDNFCQKLDNSAVGISSTITRLSQLLKKHDGELWRHLEITTKVNPQFYAFRWITLLLTQEFNFADALRIWDTLLSDPEGPQETLLRVCCAMLILVRTTLLAGDFTSNLKLLQKYPETNIPHLLNVANKLRQT